METDEMLKGLIEAVPLQFHLSFQSQADEAAIEIGRRARSQRYTRQQFGMSLYPELEFALLKAAEESGLTGRREQTLPPGGSFALIRAGKFIIGRHSGGNVRALPSKRSRYRRRLAQHNAFLDPQAQLFEDFGSALSERVYLSYLTVADYRTQSGCSHIAIGAYSPDFSRWTHYWPFETIVHAYSGEENVPDAAQPEIPDVAIPKLKKR